MAVRLAARSRWTGSAAVAGMTTLEEIAYLLSQMNSDERQEFRQVLKRIAAAEPERADFIHSLPAALGLDGEP
ncbi:hypothetical protein [Micromonospora coerulea]|uniref:hypothetical protein n=1 Tax=Micromonospora coerulea TaxID=47856 RepID=UPI001908921F|nr:hypothetical protein [Micromonospora veneta]